MKNIKIAAIAGSALLIITLLLGASESPSTEYYGDEEYFEQYSNGNNNNQSENDYQNNGFSNNNQNGTTHQNQKSQTYNNQRNQFNGGSEKRVMQPMMDQQRGIPFGHYPLPASWKIKKDGWFGPQGLIIKFVSSQPMDLSQQKYHTPKKILEAELAPQLQQNGGRVTGEQNLGSVAQCDKNYAQLIAMDNGIQTQNEALGFSIDVKGVKAYGIVKTSLSRHQYGGNWYYSVISIDADASYIDQAMEHMIFALSNYKPNMQQVAMYKRDEQMKSNQSWATHNSKMRSNQSAFDARNKAWQDASKATNDAIMGSWKSLSESFDRSNQMITNGIWDENTVTNPWDGTQHQTDNTYDRTFMNAFGDQIQTNDQFYEPGMDYNVHGYEEVFPNGG